MGKKQRALIHEMDDKKTFISRKINCIKKEFKDVDILEAQRISISHKKRSIHVFITFAEEFFSKLLIVDRCWIKTFITNLGSPTNRDALKYFTISVRRYFVGP